jgi:hypothetical protein
VILLRLGERLVRLGLNECEAAKLLDELPDENLHGA